jgi:hypothetical protein
MNTTRAGAKRTRRLSSVSRLQLRRAARMFFDTPIYAVFLTLVTLVAAHSARSTDPE